MHRAGMAAYNALQMILSLVILTILVHCEVLHPNAGAVVAALVKLYQIQYTVNRSFLLEMYATWSLLPQYTTYRRGRTPI